MSAEVWEAFPHTLIGAATLILAVDPYPDATADGSSWSWEWVAGSPPTTGPTSIEDGTVIALTTGILAAVTTLDTFTAVAADSSVWAAAA